MSAARQLLSVPPAEIRTLENASDAYATAVRAVKTLGDELDRQFTAMERASAALEAEGLDVHATFTAPLQAAYRAWSEQHGHGVPLRVPGMLR